MKIGDRVFVSGYIDEIRKDTVIVRNDGGYFGTVLSEVTGELPSAQPEIIHCKDCEYFDQYSVECMNENGLKHIKSKDDYCKYAERRTDEQID